MSNIVAGGVCWPKAGASVMAE